MTDTPTTPDQWEQQLHDAAADIGDTEGQPDGITNDSHDLPDPARAARRVGEFLAAFGDGIILDPDDCPGVPPLYARDLEALRATLAAVTPELDRLAREARIWCRRANTVMADAVEQTARNMQRCGQLRRERDEARTEVERLRARIGEPLHICDEWDSPDGAGQLIGWIESALTEPVTDTDPTACPTNPGGCPCRDTGELHHDPDPDDIGARHPNNTTEES